MVTHHVTRGLYSEVGRERKWGGGERGGGVGGGWGGGGVRGENRGDGEGGRGSALQNHL